MLQRIAAELDRIETGHGVRILYACESGSRAWGFASPDSDWDVRFIFARPREEYLSIDRPRDVIEQPITDSLDVSGWDILKACHLARKSNGPLWEWLNSPIVYRENGLFAGKLRALFQKHSSPRAAAKHYVSMAKGNFHACVRDRDAVARKKFLYVLRPLAAARYLVLRGRFPPTEFRAALDGVKLPAAIRGKIDALLAEKAASRELDLGTPDRELIGHMAGEIEKLSASIENLPERPVPSDPFNALVARTLKRAPRPRRRGPTRRTNVGASR